MTPDERVVRLVEVTGPRRVRLRTRRVRGGVALFGDEADGTDWQVGVDGTGHTVDLRVGPAFRVARQDRRTWRRDGRVLFAVDGAAELVAPCLPGGWTALVRRDDLPPGPVDVAVLDDPWDPVLRPARATVQRGPGPATVHLSGSAPVLVAAQPDGTWLDERRWTVVGHGDVAGDEIDLR